MSLGMTLFLGWLMGMEHALDADHVVAVSTIASRSRNLWQSCIIGIFWGLGHSATLLLMCLLMMGLHYQLPGKAGLAFEFTVGVVLVLLGAGILKEYVMRRLHAHAHEHGLQTHAHFHLHAQNPGHEHDHPVRQRARALGIGAIHGLAGSAALMILVASRLDSWYMALAYVFIFGLGAIMGMLLISGLLSLPFLLAARTSDTLHRNIRLLTGTASVALGLFIMWDIGLVRGLFRTS